MRTLLVAVTALAAIPAVAQDHSGHPGHAEHEAPPAPNHGDGHADPQADPEPGTEHDHVSMDHGAMDHGAMDHDAMDHGAMDHGTMDHGSHGEELPVAEPPARAFEGPAHAADAIFGGEAMAKARAEVAAMDRASTGTAMLERLEARVGQGEDLYLWDAQAWYGGDFDKLWLKSEGEGAFGAGLESAEFQALWSHAVGPWFDLQAGVRYDLEPDSRAHAVLGVQGLAPYMFEVDAAVFLSDRGDVTARFEAEYDQRITQSLILQPRAEVSLAAQDIPERDIGAGVTSIEAGLRLRYEFVREFAPYLGVSYEAKLGETASRARAIGEDPTRLSLLIGLRAWF